MTDLPTALRTRSETLAACFTAQDPPRTPEEGLRLGLAVGRLATLEELADRGWRPEGEGL